MVLLVIVMSNNRYLAEQVSTSKIVFTMSNASWLSVKTVHSCQAALIDADEDDARKVHFFGTAKTLPLPLFAVLLLH